MKLFSIVAAALVLASIVPWQPAVAVADFGKIAGSVSIETGSPSERAVLPAGLIVEIDLACSQPGERSVPCGAYLILTKKGGPRSLPFAIGNVPFAPTQVTVHAVVRSVNPGEHYYEHALKRTDTNVSASDPGYLVLDSENPTYDATRFEARGLHVPKDATADGSVPHGSAIARIDLRPAPGGGEAPTAFPEIIDTFAYRVDDVTKKRLGSTMLAAAPECPANVPCAQLTIDDLPLDTPLSIGILNHGEGIAEYDWHAQSSKGRHVDGESCPIVLHLNASVDSSCSFIGTPKAGASTEGPTPSPAATASAEPSESPSPEATASPSPEATASPTPDATAAPSPEATATSNPEPTATASPEQAATAPPGPATIPSAPPSPINPN